MKNVFLIFIVLFSSLIVQAQDFCTNCCTPTPVTIYGTVVGKDKTASTVIAEGKVRILAYEWNNNVVHTAYLNPFGYYTLTVNTCDYVSTQPSIPPKFLPKGFIDIYTPAAHFGWLEAPREDNFEMELWPL